jgi:hypothetical protein
MAGEIKYQRPVTARALFAIRRNALLLESEGDDDAWSNEVVLRLIAEIDRLTYMWFRGGPEDLIHDEDGHLTVNGQHSCTPDGHCVDAWYPPPAESWTLPS